MRPGYLRMIALCSPFSVISYIHIVRIFSAFIRYTSCTRIAPDDHVTSPSVRLLALPCCRVFRALALHRTQRAALCWVTSGRCFFLVMISICPRNAGFGYRSSFYLVRHEPYLKTATLMPLYRILVTSDII